MEFPRSLASPLGRVVASANPRTLIKFQKRKPAAKKAAKPKSSATGRNKKKPVKPRRPTKKIKIKNGRVHLPVPGHEGIQAVAPSHLIRFIPKTHLGVAARRVLRSMGKSPIKRRKARVISDQAWANYKLEQDNFESWLKNPGLGAYWGKMPPRGKYPSY